MNGGPARTIGFPFAGGLRVQVALLVGMTASRLEAVVSGALQASRYAVLGMERSSFVDRVSE
jgi:hypothetical protein